MPDYLLDTNILRFWYDTNCSNHAIVMARIAIARNPDPMTQYVSRLYVSVITLGEIEYGHRVADLPDPVKQAAYSRFVREHCPVAIEINKHVVESYGKMRAWLFKKCVPNSKKSKTRRAEELICPTTGRELGIDENDVWIAAQAFTHKFVLVTNDSRGNFGKLVREFDAQLIVEDWAS